MKNEEWRTQCRVLVWKRYSSKGVEVRDDGKFSPLSRATPSICICWNYDGQFGGVVVSSRDLMDGVITAIVAFIFVCIIFPSLVKSRPQYYVALFLVLVATFLNGIGKVSGTGSFGVFVTVLVACLVVCSMILLILSAGGLAVRDLAGDIGKTIEVIRRGGEKETLIVPRTGETPKVREPATSERTRITLDE